MFRDRVHGLCLGLMVRTQGVVSRFLFFGGGGWGLGVVGLCEGGISSYMMYIPEHVTH